MLWAYNVDYSFRKTDSGGSFSGATWFRFGGSAGSRMPTEAPGAMQVRFVLVSRVSPLRDSAIPFAFQMYVAPRSFFLEIAVRGTPRPSPMRYHALRLERPPRGARQLSLSATRAQGAPLAAIQV